MGVTATIGTYRFGLFRLDARGTGVSRLDDDGAWIPVAIGARARDLLSLLVRRNGEVLPRDEIMQAVWPGVAHDSPHFQTAPKVSAKTGISASISANRSTNGSRRTSGIVGMSS